MRDDAQRPAYCCCVSRGSRRFDVRRGAEGLQASRLVSSRTRAASTPWRPAADHRTSAIGGRRRAPCRKPRATRRGTRSPKTSSPMAARPAGELMAAFFTDHPTSAAAPRRRRLIGLETGSSAKPTSPSQRRLRRPSPAWTSRPRRRATILIGGDGAGVRIVEGRPRRTAFSASAGPAAGEVDVTSKPLLTCAERRRSIAYRRWPWKWVDVLLLPSGRPQPTDRNRRVDLLVAGAHVDYRPSMYMIARRNGDRDRRGAEGRRLLKRHQQWPNAPASA